MTDEKEPKAHSDVKLWVGVILSFLAVSGVGVGAFDTNKEQTLVQAQLVLIQEYKETVESRLSKAEKAIEKNRGLVAGQWTKWDERADDIEEDVGDNDKRVTVVEEKLIAHIRADDRKATPSITHSHQ